MTDTAHKYPLYPLTFPDAYKTQVALPEGAVIIHVAEHPVAGPCIWAQVPGGRRASALDVVRTFAIVGTGHLIPDGATHIGTWQQSRGEFVWHLYELAL